MKFLFYEGIKIKPIEHVVVEEQLLLFLLRTILRRTISRIESIPYYGLLFKRETSSSFVMSLFPYEDVLTKEIESWKGFADRLPTEEDRKVFMEMFNNCYKYAKAINAKGRPFPTEPVIMTLLFSQHKLIEWLEAQIQRVK